MNRSACVYTVLTGGYEPLNEQPVARDSSVPFICVTDDPALTSSTWQIRCLPRLFPLDAPRSQRQYKTLPWLALPDFACSIYIDNSVTLRAPPERLLEGDAAGTVFALPAHPDRGALLDEFVAVAELGLDDAGRVFEQLQHYQLEAPDLLAAPVHWCGIIVRDHHAPAVRRLGEHWFAHILRYSRRDQLSLPAAFAAAGLAPSILPLPALSSWFHEWPVRAGRVAPGSPLHPGMAAMPPVARIRHLETTLRASQDQVRVLQEANAKVAAHAEALQAAFDRMAQYAAHLERGNRADAA